MPANFLVLYSVPSGTADGYTSRQEADAVAAAERTGWVHRVVRV